MTTYLLYDDCLRSYEMRHEIGESIGDPFAFIEHDGRRIVVGSMLEQAIFERREDVVDEFWPMTRFGSEELDKDPAVATHLIGPEIVVRALNELGTNKVVVPPSFRLAVADYLRERGIELDVDPDEWVDRRRRKTPWELEGIERAQRAAETAMVTAARMFRDAERTNSGQLRFEGEILTCELVREAMSGELLSQGAESQDILISVGDKALDAHDPGMGPIAPDTTIIVDCFPRDRRTGVYSDMTRTFVVGDPSDEVLKLHKHVRAALDIAFEHLKPGRNDAHQKVCEYFEAQGYPTKLNHEGDEPLREGYFHSLGHGVGLAVHERPSMGRRSDELQVGDVIAVEPGLYFAGVGGIRLEDTVMVGDNGVEHFTDPYPYDLTP